MIKVLFVCHGNICRSPMAEFVLKDMIEKRGLCDDFYIESAATSRDEIWNGVGSPIYPPARDMLRRNNIGRSAYTDFSSKRARQITPSDYEEFDYILCADANNISNVKRITGEDCDGKIHLMLDIPIVTGRSISDPWYTGDFVKAYDDVKCACENLLGYLVQQHDYN